MPGLLIDTSEQVLFFKTAFSLLTTVVLIQHHREDPMKWRTRTSMSMPSAAGAAGRGG